MRTKRDRIPEAIDESTESTITIQPDGRIFAFGITQPVAAVLAAIPTSDERMKNLLGHITGLNAESANCAPLKTQEIPRCPSLEQ